MYHNLDVKKQFDDSVNVIQQLIRGSHPPGYQIFKFSSETVIIRKYGQSMTGAALLSFTQLFITVSVLLELTFQPRASGHHQLIHSYKKIICTG